MISFDSNTSKKVIKLKQFIEIIKVKTKAFEILNLSNKIDDLVKESNIVNGLLNLSVLHTSCSLMIQENADSTVLMDIKKFLDEIAPEKDYLHDTEGPDDMPAHLKTLLTQTNLTISVKNKFVVLGGWQGIFLLEHRQNAKNREVFFHLMGE